MNRYLEKISKEQFEIDFKNYDCNYEDIILPKRSTSKSAGYDFFLPFDITIKEGEILKIPTGIKVNMLEDEMFCLYIRSGIGFKYNIRLCNQVGIIDSDYYNNPSNEGNMWFAIQNEGKDTYTFKKGDRLIQGIFQKYLITDNDIVDNTIRMGGLGSTNKRGEEDER